MELSDFTDALAVLSPDDLHAIAAALGDHESAADEVDAWRATLAIDRALRRAHRTRVAARAASVASHAVLAAAAGHGIALPDAEITHVARAAAQLARGMIAGHEAAGEVQLLLAHWAPVLAAA